MVRKILRCRDGAVLIVSLDSKSFADVIRKIWTVDTSGSNFILRVVTNIRDGAVLIRTIRDGRTEQLTGLLQDVLEEQGIVKDRTVRVIFDILDFDCMTETDEVMTVLKEVLGTEMGEENLVIRRKN